MRYTFLLLVAFVSQARCDQYSLISPSLLSLGPVTVQTDELYSSKYEVKIELPYKTTNYTYRSFTDGQIYKSTVRIFQSDTSKRYSAQYWQPKTDAKYSIRFIDTSVHANTAEQDAAANP
jgi:hypothetical protein